jgi:two-component system, cell cycle sensor histidine kinase and response regulator CckA
MTEAGREHGPVGDSVANFHLVRAIRAVEGLMPGAETVLVVDDEPDVRKIVCRTLRSDGYTVLEAGHPRVALHLCETPSIKIDLLVSDVLMPEMCGCELAMKTKELRPGIKILLISGYPGSENVQEAITRCKAAFIAKPFGPQELIEKVKELLAAG